MADGILVSGPAGSGKSQHARELIAEAEDRGEILVLADYQSTYVSLTDVRRDPESGKFPLRNPELLALTEFVRQGVIAQAGQRGFGVVATNSDGSLTRREYMVRKLSEALGPSGVIREDIIDPGEHVVRDRLATEVERIGAAGRVADKVFSVECDRAVNRWYRRYERSQRTSWTRRYFRRR